MMPCAAFVSLFYLMVLLPCFISNNIIPIHFQWKPLSDIQLHEWYKPIDICMLSAGENITTQDHKTKTCKSSNRLLAQFCGPGMGARYACPSPLNNRPYFYKALSGFDDAKQMPLKRSFDILSSKKAVVAFIGDSMMMQTFRSFLCELQRENIDFVTHNVDDVCHQVVSISSDASRTIIPVHYFRIGRLETVSLCRKNRERRFDKVGSWLYAKTETEKLQQEYNTIILIVNLGVWYNLPSTYSQDLNIILPWLDEVANRGSGDNSVLFVETAPSHWNTANGYYDSKRDNTRRRLDNVVGSTPTCCYPIQNQSFEADWRNAMLHKEVERRALSRVSILPLAAALRQAHNMHTCAVNDNPRKWDCTHYCFWPTQMQPMWYVMATIVETTCVGSDCDLRLNAVNSF